MYLCKNNSILVPSPIFPVTLCLVCNIKQFNINMESGIKFTLEKVVTNEMTARNMASGTLDVLQLPQ